MAGALEKAWRRSATLAPEHALALPFAGERVAVIGTGMARGIARAYAALREDATHGPTDAPAADEVPSRRGYERTVLLSRSGDEPALVELVEWLRSEAILAIAIGAPPGSPLDELAGATVPLAEVAGPGDDGAYALTSLAVLRHHVLGTTGGADAARAARARLPDVRGVRRWAFVGHRWTLGLAEAAARAFRRSGADAVAGPASDLEAGDLGPLDGRTLVWRFERDDATTEDRAGADEVDDVDCDEGPATRTAVLDPAAELLLALRVAESLR